MGEEGAAGRTCARPLRVALTGGIATGKSYVRARFQDLGIPTIDSDTLAREVVAPGTPGLQAVIERFGTGVLDPAGGLDRRRLGAIVFADPAERKALEAIVHPEVVRRSNAWFATLDPSHPFAIADIPLLYEVALDRAFDAVVVAACDPAEQLRRLMQRDRLPELEARQRIAAQLPISEKVARADHVIWTDGSFAETDAQVRRVAQALGASDV